jgi:hypothetical protein
MRSLPWKKIAGAAGLALLGAAHVIHTEHLRLAVEALGGFLAYYGDHAAEPKEPVPAPVAASPTPEG